MDPSLLIPVPDTIPVAWGWFKLFLVLTFFCHLLFMNAMLGTGIITLLSVLFSSTGSRSRTLLTAREVSAKLPYIIAFTVNTGVAPLLFVQVLYGHFIYTSSVLMAVYWLSVVGILLIAYYSAYIYDFKFETLGSARSVFLAVSVVLLLFIGFLFSNNLTLMLTPEKWVYYFENPKGTMLNLSEPTLMPRYLHFVVASIAMGGLVLALIETFRHQKKAADKKIIVNRGMKWFTYATIVQILIGIWFLISLPKAITLLFLGGNITATLLFLLALIGIALSLVFGFKVRVKPCTGSTLFVIIIMVLMREWVRGEYLKPYFSPTLLKVAPQYTSLILFAVVLMVGIGLVGYMIKLAWPNNISDKKRGFR